MDLSTTSTSWGVDDQSWLASRTGLDDGRSITLDLSKFTKADHYPDGFLKSGLPLQRNGTTKLYEPYVSGTLDGHLLKQVHVSDPTARAMGSLFWRGVVDARFLPAAVNTAGRSAVSGRIRYENG